MMRWDSWKELSKIPWDLSVRGSGIKAFGKSFVVDGGRKRHSAHTPAILGVWTVVARNGIAPRETTSSCLPTSGPRGLCI